MKTEQVFLFALVSCTAVPLPQGPYLCTPGQNDCLDGYICLASTNTCTLIGTESSGTTASSTTAGGATTGAAATTTGSAATTGGPSVGSATTSSGTTGARATTSGSSTSGVSGSSTSGSSGTDAGCGTLTVEVVYDYSNADTQAVVAVADGTPYLDVGLAASPTYWHIERAKSWITINNMIQSASGTDQVFSACLPPGEYTVQFWDVACGPDDSGCGSFENGTPPTVTYAWEIGDPSRPIVLTAGETATVRVEDTQSNVPTFDNFYGTYSLWSYGDCDAGCASGTTCYQGTCYDLNVDVRNCGNGGAACTAEGCCSGGCVDLGSDQANCGGCGVVCGEGTVCQSAECVAADAGCGLIVAQLGSEFDGVPDHQGLMAVADGGPYINVGMSSSRYWPAEMAKTWYTFDNYTQSQPFIKNYYSICVPPGGYTAQFWDIWGAGGGDDNGTPPTVTYLWQVGDSTRVLQVSQGSTAVINLDVTKANVPTSDNFYGSYSLWSYGGCFNGQSDCPTGTTCFQGSCYDLGYDIRNCGAGGVACTADNCCAGGCVDLGSDSNNCGACGIVCDAGTSCSGSLCN